MEIDLYVFLRFYIIADVVIPSLKYNGSEGLVNEYDLDINSLYMEVSFSADVKNSLHKVDD